MGTERHSLPAMHFQIENHKKRRKMFNRQATTDLMDTLKRIREKDLLNRIVLSDDQSV